MRFGSFSQSPNNIGEKKDEKIKKNISGVLIRVLMFVFIFVVLVTIGFYGYKKLSSKPSIEPDTYYAVFLTNGQVYFGKPESMTRDELVLIDVYYLQLSGDATAVATADPLSEPKFALVKLGKEIHGPVDTLYINRDNVLFYEQLRKDSQVVTSIRNFK